MKKNRSFPIGILLFVMIFVVIFYGITSVSKTTKEKQLESLERSINRAVVQCYATEGYYPESLDYIQDHYGISYDKHDFFVKYTPIARNIKPDVTVLMIHR